MIKGDKEYLDDLAKNYACAEHRTPLVVAWHAGEKSYVLRCGHGHFPEEVNRLLSLTQEYKAGEELPEPIKSNVEKGMRKSQQQTGRKPTAMTFQGVPAADLATGELLAPEVVKSLVNYARRYNLDPARGHVVLMYSKPYITIDGYLYHARHEGPPYSVSSRPLTKEERVEYQIGAEDHAWLATIKFLKEYGEFTGLGIVTKEEMTATSKKDTSKLRSPVVAAHPWQLAQKRAEWQALRRAFPIGETEEEQDGNTTLFKE